MHMVLFRPRLRPTLVVATAVAVASIAGLSGRAGAAGEGDQICNGAGSLGSINNAPLAVDDEAWTAPGEVITIEVLANDRDFDGDTLVITEVLPAGFGAAAVDGDTVTYTPADDFTGFDVFEYVISDERCGEHTAQVRVQVSMLPPPPDEATPEPPVTGVITFTG